MSEVRHLRSDKRLRWELWRNTYAMGSVRFYTMVIRDRHYAKVLEGTPGDGSWTISRIRSAFGRRLMPWFWPRIWEASRWVQATDEGWYPPSVYQISAPGPLMVRLLENTPITNSVVDLGCNSGTNLNFLHEAGFRRLAGVDAGRQALSLFSTTYPETWQSADVRHDLFQHWLSTTPNSAFDTLHCNGVTIELVHPSFPIVQEICRVSRESVFISLTEQGHSYPRYYIRQFEAHGFRLVWCARPLDVTTVSSLLHFVRSDGPHVDANLMGWRRTGSIPLTPE